MTAGRVWAPHASTISLRLGDGSDLAMRPCGGDWFEPVQPLQPGQRYGFIVDGDGPFPDPRSLSLPDGVHGLSRVVDPAVFARDTSWPGIEILGTVIYELHIGSFTPAGTFDAAVERLADLVSLGIGAVEVMPVAAFAGSRGWGYDGVAPWSVHEAYGDQEGLVRFVDAAHACGLGVIMDVVHNHLGPEGSYVSRFGPYFTSRHQTPWGDGLNFDGHGSRNVRDFFLGAAHHLLVEVGVDALRLDAVHAIIDDSPLHFLDELSSLTTLWEAETGRRLTLIAESDLNQPAMIEPLGTSPEARGMDGQWADDVHHSLHAFFARDTSGYYVDFGTAATLAQALSRVFIHAGSYSTFRRACWGAPVDVDSPFYDGHAFVAFLQNHDQVGNRALGDRFASQAGATAQAAAAALYLLSAFTPLVFMGEEWAASSPFPFFSDLGAELGSQVTEGRAREFAAMGWAEPTPDPQAESTFDSAHLIWAERTAPPHREMLHWYSALITLRKAYPDLRDPRISAVRVEVVDDEAVVLARGSFRIVAARSPIDSLRVASPTEVIASWGDHQWVDDATLRLLGAGVVILHTEEKEDDADRLGFSAEDLGGSTLR